jgi:hypothetical protein
MNTKTMYVLAVAGLTASSLLVPTYAQQEMSIFEQADTAAKQSAKDFKPAADRSRT